MTFEKMFAQRPFYTDGNRLAEHRGSEFHSTGTYIVQDCEGFSQRLTQQPDPFGKQLVQMFTEMLTDNNTGGKQTVITKST